MARSFNKLTLVGYLGRDPESKLLPSGDQVAEFTLATDDKKKDGTTLTTWFRVSVFGKTAEVAARYLATGSYVYIDGTLTQCAYTDREGHPRQALEVRARDLQMLDKASERGAAPASVAASTADAPSTLDDVPF